MDWRTYGLTDWRTDGRTDWRTDGLTDWRTDGLTDWQTDGLTDWRTDGLTDWQCKKGALKNPGETFFKNPLKHFWKISRRPMEKGRIECYIISWTGGNSEQSGNVQIFVSNFVFFIWRKKRCSPLEKGRIELLITSLEPGGNSEPNDDVQIIFL